VQPSDEFLEGIQQLHLFHWWQNDLSDEERREFLEALNETAIKFEGFFSATAFYWTMEGDEIVERHKSPGGYLVYMNDCKNPELFIKIARVAKKLLDQTDLHKLERWEFRELHFDYQTLMGNFYYYRDKLPGALDDAIACCKRLIYISPEVIKDPQMYEPTGKLPSNLGYDQLAIIAEKQKKLSSRHQNFKTRRKPGMGGGLEVAH